MSTSPVVIVTFKRVNDIVIADPPSATVTQANTYLSFELLIDGLKFADTGTIQVDPAYAASFRGPWRESDHRASLVDLNSMGGEIAYTVSVVGPSGAPYNLPITPPPTISNTGPQ